jgi:hypothetical protein
VIPSVSDLMESYVMLQSVPQVKEHHTFIELPAANSDCMIVMVSSIAADSCSANFVQSLTRMRGAPTPDHFITEGQHGRWVKFSVGACCSYSRLIHDALYQL